MKKTLQKIAVLFGMIFTLIGISSIAQRTVTFCTGVIMGAIRTTAIANVVFANVNVRGILNTLTQIPGQLVASLCGTTTSYVAAISIVAIWMTRVWIISAVQSIIVVVLGTLRIGIMCTMALFGVFGSFGSDGITKQHPHRANVRNYNEIPRINDVHELPPNGKFYVLNRPTSAGTHPNNPITNI